MIPRWCLALALFTASCAAPAPIPVADKSSVTGPSVASISLARAVPVDEGLRAEYARCDASDMFKGQHFPINNAAGKTVWYSCHSDPNRLEALVRLARTPASNPAVIFTSKLGLDRDGSWIACNKRGVTDQCGTSLMLPARDRQPCNIRTAARSGCMPVNSDKVPYVVLPASGPHGAPASEFKDATGIQIGDFGVVVYNGKVMPVIVADASPYYKIGEGSMALHRALGSDPCGTRDQAGGCTATKHGVGSIGSGVTTIIFPSSRTSGLTLDTISSIVDQQGRALYDALARAYPG